MKKIGIATVYTGFNYGSALQAFATKYILGTIGYDGKVFKLKGSFSKGRDIRLGKLLSMSFRSIFHFKEAQKIASVYKSTYRKNYDAKTLEQFHHFYDKYIDPVFVSYHTLRKISKTDEYAAFICGSDQVWNSTAFYVDPFYYLRFAPRYKRIAFAPSLGKSFVPRYNKRIMKRYISEIGFLSTREQQGKTLIEELTGKKCECLVDPTLFLSEEEWTDTFKLKPTDGKYILAYFLDEPSDLAKKSIFEARKIMNCKVISIPYFEGTNDGSENMSAGPIEFLSLIKNAQAIFTDSFHGTVFSIIFKKNFYVFSRNYGGAANQSSRIISLLEKMGLSSYFDVEFNSENSPPDYIYCRKVIEIEKNKMLDYLNDSLGEVNK